MNLNAAMNSNVLELVDEKLKTNHFSEALALLDRFLPSDIIPPGDPGAKEVRLLRAICLMRLKRRPEAYASLLSLTVEHPKDYEVLTAMAEFTQSSKAYESAIEWATKAVAANPERAEAYGILGTCYARLGKAHLAIEALEKSLAIHPDVAPHQFALGSSYAMLQRHQLAARHLQIAIRLNPSHSGAYSALASSFMRLGQTEKALGALEAGMRIAPEDADMQTAAAAAYTVLRNDEAAEKYHRRAAERSPGGKIALGFWLVEQGRFEDARALFTGVIEANPNLGAAYYGLLQSHKSESLDEGIVAQMERALTDKGITPHSRMYLCFALGSVQESRQDYERAMRLFDEANGLALRTLKFTSPPFDLSHRRAEKERVIRCFESWSDDRLWGDSKIAPIFIVGMPRSGTSLLDQILTSHPMVSAGGELRFWIEKGSELAAKNPSAPKSEIDATASQYAELLGTVGGSKPRQTDKMPGNFLYAGIIHRALPNARFLHLRRHPIDTCLSVYTTFLGTGGTMPYSRAAIVDYYREYLLTMEYWRENLPSNRFMELDYEHLTEAPEDTIRRILAFCDLPWDESCLRHERNLSAINTPSRWQARQPIYRSSVGRWRKFEPWLQEFAELKDLLPPEGESICPERCS